ncbi:MAG: PhzF family phenazine biosynthesis protein, partial [Oscillospiraceae bacterium]|nr:PhzF family phenazine biosynthesis protein [Oscillospiraceae bacterium]
MKAYVMDAFSAQIFGGNQAGVALPETTLSDALMQQIAAEFKHSETAFVQKESDGSVTLRYFTPAGEVELCGHATIASFALLRSLNLLQDGLHTAHTKAGDLTIDVAGDTVWMDMAPPVLLRELPEAEWSALYEAYGLTVADRPEGFVPKIVSTGLADIMMPVRDHETLMRAVQNAPVVTDLSKFYDVTGVHMFCLGGEDCTAYCSNYAPLYDIPEECATGTSNGALTYYLYLQDLVKAGEENVFVQGEHMNRPSEIRSRLKV